jgi:succinate dehydrogenase / fumarate reductase iron-sulfur subunit
VAAEKVRVRVRRQDGPQGRPYWQEFDVERTPNMNVIYVLMQIQRNPVTADGRPTAPVYWESNCLEEVCGSCSMVINGKARQACSTLVDKLEEPITLEPMSSFPVVRDLAVDRSRMFDDLRRLRAWVDIDGTYDLGPGPRQGPEEQQLRYELSRCMTCGVCCEVCPNYTQETDFVGAFAINQVRLFNTHPSGALHKAQRLDALMGPGGIQECGNSQNCVKACPKEIPLTDSIAAMNRETTWRALTRWLSR